jgi:hypothetical protein
MIPVRRLKLATLVLGALAACGGQTLGGIPGDASTDTPVTIEPDGAKCVDIDPASFATSCTQDSDCVDVTTGKLCTGSCQCGGTAINTSGQSRYESDIAAIGRGAACPCPFEGEPRCVQGACTLCGPGDTTAGCSDGGTGQDDGGGPSDAGSPDGGGPVDARPACVDIVLSSFDVSCNSPTDCVMVTSGEICTGGCACGGSAINKSSLSRYDEEISGLKTAECPCVAEGTLGCLHGTCTVCGPGAPCPPDK